MSNQYVARIEALDGSVREQPLTAVSYSAALNEAHTACNVQLGETARVVIRMIREESLIDHLERSAPNCGVE